MAYYIGVVSQKGGVGKSTISRLIAREYTLAGWETLVADMDVNQATTYRWNARRLGREIEPNISVQQFASVPQALKAGDKYDLIVFDGSPAASRETEQIAKNCQLIVLPTSESFEDLEPQVHLANELASQGANLDKIVFVLCRVGKSESQIREAQEYISRTPFKLIEGYIEDKPAWKTALLEGRTLNETTYDTLNSKAALVAQSIANEFDNTTRETA